MTTPTRNEGPVGEQPAEPTDPDKPSSGEGAVRAEQAERAEPETPNPLPVPHVIRGMRVMALVRWLLLALVTALAAYTVWTFWGPHGNSQSAVREDRFYCGMHPQIRSPDPGECPICHMTLEPIPQDRRSETAPPAQPGGGTAAPGDVMPVSVTAEKQRLIGLATTAVVRESLGDRLRVPGVVSAPETGIAQVRVRAPGFVERVAVRQTGVHVARGQTLAWIYSPEIYRAQEELLAAARWNDGSTATGTPAAGAVEIGRAARQGLELLGLSSADIDEILRAGHPMRAIPVRAPSSGYVTRFNAVLGFRADPEMVLYEIADLSTVWVVASVYERDLGHVRVGMTARFAVTGRSTAPVEARVALVEPQLDEGTRTSRVRLVVGNRDLALRPGQFGEVNFELPATEGLLVPRDAVIRTGEHEYVYVATGDDRFEPRIVRTGTALGDRVQVLHGLAVGDLVVTRGSFMLDSESRLQASLAAAPSPSSSASSDAPSSEQGPRCEEAFDRERFPEGFAQCRACERQHAGMGSMVADCKSAIERPWR